MKTTPKSSPRTPQICTKKKFFFFLLKNCLKTSTKLLSNFLISKPLFLGQEKEKKNKKHPTLWVISQALKLPSSGKEPSRRFPKSRGGEARTSSGLTQNPKKPTPCLLHPQGCLSFLRGRAGNPKKPQIPVSNLLGERGVLSSEPQMGAGPPSHRALGTLESHPIEIWDLRSPIQRFGVPVTPSHRVLGSPGAPSRVLGSL